MRILDDHEASQWHGASGEFMFQVRFVYHRAFRDHNFIASGIIDKGVKEGVSLQYFLLGAVLDCEFIKPSNSIYLDFMRESVLGSEIIREIYDL